MYDSILVNCKEVASTFELPTRCMLNIFSIPSRFSSIYNALHFFFDGEENFTLTMDVTAIKSKGTLLTYKNVNIYFYLAKINDIREVCCSFVEPVSYAHKSQYGVDLATYVILIDGNSYLKREFVALGLNVYSNFADVAFVFLVIKHYMISLSSDCYRVALESIALSNLLVNVRSICRGFGEQTFAYSINSLFFKYAKDNFGSDYKLELNESRVFISTESCNTDKHIKSFCMFVDVMASALRVVMLNNIPRSRSNKKKNLFIGCAPHILVKISRIFSFLNAVKCYFENPSLENEQKLFNLDKRNDPSCLTLPIIKSLS